MKFQGTVKPIGERKVTLNLELTETEALSIMLWLGQTSAPDRVAQVSRDRTFRQMPLPASVEAAVRTTVFDIYSALHTLNEEHHFKFRMD